MRMRVCIWCMCQVVPTTSASAWFQIILQISFQLLLARFSSVQVDLWLFKIFQIHGWYPWRVREFGVGARRVRRWLQMSARLQSYRCLVNVLILVHQHRHQRIVGFSIQSLGFQPLSRGVASRRELTGVAPLNTPLLLQPRAVVRLLDSPGSLRIFPIRSWTTNFMLCVPNILISFLWLCS